MAKDQERPDRPGAPAPRTPAVAGSNWTVTEVEATVTAYFDLLDRDLAGEEYQVRAVEKALLAGPLQGRPSASLQLQAISSLLHGRGMPHVSKIRPRGISGLSVLMRGRALREAQIRGFAPAGDEEALAAEADVADSDGEFDPDDDQDARRRLLRRIAVRRGQQTFRKALLKAYDGRCAITGCDAEPALEAAHIRPYRGPQTNHPTNGLLLRADIHTLFDLGLVGVDTATMTVLVSPALSATEYATLAGRPLRPPTPRSAAPNKKALDRHRRLNAL